jgi:hypothetical protein
VPFGLQGIHYGRVRLLFALSEEGPSCSGEIQGALNR